MKVLLLGATGRTGKHVLDYLLKENYAVHVLVRNKIKVEQRADALTIFEGDVADKQTLLHAAKDCNAIISILNISRTSDFPWAKLRTGKTFLSMTMKNVIEISKQLNITRLIVCSAWGVHETKKDIPFWFRLVIDYSNVGVAYNDHERQEDLIMHSGMNYTIVRPVRLTNATKEREILVSQNNIPKPRLMISRKDAAKFMVEQIKNDAYFGKAVTISNK